MAKQIINVGSGPNTKNGDPIRSAFQKVNQNFDELYALTGGNSLELTEIAQDYAAEMFTEGIHSGITVEYDDENNRINLTVSEGVDLSAINQSIIPNTDVTYDLGSATNRFRDLYLSGSSIDLGGTVISVVDGQLQIGGTSIADVARAAVADGSTGFNYSEVDDTSEIGVTADVFDFGDGTTIDMQNSSILLTGSTITGDIAFASGSYIANNGNIVHRSNEAFALVTSTLGTDPTPSVWAFTNTYGTGESITIPYAEFPQLQLITENGIGWDFRRITGPGLSDGATPVNILVDVVGDTVVLSGLGGGDAFVLGEAYQLESFEIVKTEKLLTVDSGGKLIVDGDIAGENLDVQNADITGILTVDGPGNLIQSVTDGEASGLGGIAYSYNSVSMGVTANPVGDFNTQQSTVQVSSGSIELRSTTQHSGDPQYTSVGELSVTSSNFRISLAPGPQWQGELTFDENEFRIPSDTLVVEGPNFRLNNMSDISIPNERGLSTFNLGITSHPQYTYSISAINGNEVTVTHFGGYPIPQVDWVMFDPNSNSTTAHPVIDVIGDSNVSTVTLADDGYDYSQLSQLILWDVNQLADPWQVSISPTGDLNGITSINGVNTLTGVSEIRGGAVDQWSYIVSPSDNGTITNMAFGYFEEGGLQNILYGTTSINEITVGPLGTGPDAPLIRTLVSEENGLAIDLDISSGTSGDVSGHVTIGTGDVGTRGEIFLNAPVNVEGGTVRIDTTGSLLPATRITKEFIEFQGASQLSMPYDFGISKLSIDIATAEALSLSVSSETVNGSDTTWSGVTWEGGIFDFSTVVGWIYTDVNGVDHVISSASDIDQDGQWDIVFEGTNPDLTTEYGPGAWGGIRIWNPENVDPNTRSVQIDYDGVLTGISEIVDLQSINTGYLNYNDTIQIGSASSSGAAIQLNHPKLQILAVPPTTSKGADGDFIGLVAFDANYIYYCTALYSGPSEVAATNYFDVTDGNGHYVQADVTTPSILGTGSLSITNVMVGGVPSTEEVTSYELISGSTYRFFLASTAEPWNTLSTSRLVISPNIWKRVAWSSDTW